MEINELIGLIVVLIAFIAIPLIWKILIKYSNSDKWTNWKNGVMSINVNDIYLAGSINRRAKKAGIVTSENCDAFIHFNSDSVVYQPNEEIRYVIPLTAIDSIVDGVDYYSIIRYNDNSPHHEIIIKIKIDSSIKVIVNNEEMVRKSKHGYDNTVNIYDLNLVDSDHKMLLDKLINLIKK